MVIPSFYNSLHDSEVYPNPDTFDPERWLSPDSLANKNPKNYLVWGAGPHKCIGIEYASMNIALVLATAAVMFDWEHEVTELSSRVEYVFFFSLCHSFELLLTPFTAFCLRFSLVMAAVSSSLLESMHRRVSPDSGCRS